LSHARRKQHAIGGATGQAGRVPFDTERHMRCFVTDESASAGERTWDISTRLTCGWEILTPTGDVDFRDYMAHLCGNVKRNWFAVMPKSALLGDKGRVVLRFQIQRDGTLRVKEQMVEASSNKEPLDRAAVNAIRLSAPFQHLPEAFRGPCIDLRFIFLYNPPLKSARVPDTAPH